MSKKDIKLIVISILSTYLISFMWSHWIIFSILGFVILWCAAGHYGAILGNKAFCKEYKTGSNVFIEDGPLNWFFGLIGFGIHLEDGWEFCKQDIKKLLGVESITFQWPIKFTKKVDVGVK